MEEFIDVTSGDLFPILEAIDQGVLMADKNGYILYYNKSHAKMDGLHHEKVLGRKITEVYDLEESSSLVMRCLKKNQSIINRTNLYTAINGKVVNSINNVFPLRKNGNLIGAVNFVKDYEYLDGIISKIEGSYRKIPIKNETRFTFESIIGSTPLIREVINKAKLSSNSPSQVMLYGETGTGKELFAQSIHNYSYRKKASYMAVNCAAIPESLLEGILFGTTKGSFTGAVEKPGLFEQANGGTIFLDEINSMSIGLQGKLLRVLQEKKVRRVGAEKESVLDLKIISSANVLPQEAIANGNLRKDLFYRLSVVFLAIPPLRDRLDDIENLTKHFISKHNRIMDKKVHRLSAEIRNYFKAYQWPGNIRELENLIEGAMNMVGDGRLIKRHHIASEAMFIERTRDLFEKTNIVDPFRKNVQREKKSGHHTLSLKKNAAFNYSTKEGVSVDDIKEKESIIKTLIHCSGNVKKTSEKLNVSRQTLHKKINKYTINRKKIIEDIEKNRIEKSLYDANGNITFAAQTLSISRQLLNYRMKKYLISKSSYQKNQ